LFYIQSTTNNQQNILHPSADSSNSNRNLHALISELIFDAAPFLFSRKQDTGSGTIIQSLFLPSIVCRHDAVRLARRSLEIILSPVRYWNLRLVFPRMRLCIGFNAKAYTVLDQNHFQ